MSQSEEHFGNFTIGKERYIFFVSLKLRSLSPSLKVTEFYMDKITSAQTIDLKVSENHDSAVLDGGIVILKCIG